MEHFLRDVRGNKPLTVCLDEECYQGEQICVGTWCLLFKVAVADTIPDDLKRFQAGKGHIFVDDKITNDMDQQCHEHHRAFSEKVELQAMAPFVIQGKWRNMASLMTFERDMLDVDAAYKGTNVHYKDWHLPNQTEEHIMYASTDTFMSYKIGDMLQSEHGFDLHLPLLVSCSRWGRILAPCQG